MREVMITGIGSTPFGRLEGKTVAFLWDYMFRGDEIWPELKKGLAARYPTIRFIDYDVFGSTHGADEHRILATLPERIPIHFDAAGQQKTPLRCRSSNVVLN